MLNMPVCANNDFYKNYCQSAIGVPSIYLLRAVEQTIEALCALQNDVRTLIEQANRGIEKINSETRPEPLDPEDRLVSVLEDVENHIRELCEVLQQKRQSAISDRNLTGQHEEDVVREYSTAIDLLSQWYSVNRDFRWAVMEHDADLEKPIGKFTSAEDLISSLRH